MRFIMFFANVENRIDQLQSIESRATWPEIHGTSNSSNDL